MGVALRTLSVIAGTLAAFICQAQAAPVATTPAIKLWTPGDEFHDDVTLGYEFFVNTPTSVMRLGVFDGEGDGLSHDASVGLWDTNGVLLASATVPAGYRLGQRFGYFQYADITPYPLVPGKHYVIGSFSSIDDFVSSFNVNQGGSANLDPYVTIYEDRYSETKFSLHFPEATNRLGGGAWLGPNFMISIVPVPAALPLMGSALAALGLLYRRRKAADLV